VSFCYQEVIRSKSKTLSYHTSLEICKIRHREKIRNLILAKILLWIAPNFLYMFLLKVRTILLCSGEVYLQNYLCAR